MLKTSRSRAFGLAAAGAASVAAIAALIATSAAPAGASPARAAAQLSSTGPATLTAAAGVRPVAQLDLARYIGQWYQVAAIPQIFEVQCAGNSTARYVANPDGTVGVTNTCRTWWGSSSTVTGVARVENAPANSVLTVSFTNFFGKQLYFGGPNYDVIGLDPSYQWAIVVSPDRGSAFVLSRTPALTPAATTAVRSILTSNAINPCSLNTTPQTGGLSSSHFFC